MNIISCTKEDCTKFGKTISGNVYSIHVKHTNIGKIAKEMVDSISDRSWIMKMDVIDQTAYLAKADATIKKLVNDILLKVTSSVTSDFGEYLISETARRAVNIQFNHSIIPLAELWNKRMTGNSGFDFHSESPINFLYFGEAKYTNRGSPYKNAITQINDFIILKKDEQDLSDLKHFASVKALENVMQNRKAYIAAFSLDAQNPRTIFENALKLVELDPLLGYEELFLIGIEV